MAWAWHGHRCAEVGPYHIGGTPNPGTGMRRTVHGRQEQDRSQWICQDGVGIIAKDIHRRAKPTAATKDCIV